MINEIIKRKDFLKIIGIGIPIGILPDSALPRSANATGSMIPNTGIVNVKDFGAVGDGVTDDSTAFQAAINSGEIIYVPKTQNGYVVSGLSINGNKTIYGENKPKLIANNTLFNIYGSNVEISNFLIEMNGSPNGTAAFLFKTRSVSQDIERIIFSKITVQNAYISIADENSHDNPPYHKIINLHVLDFDSKFNKFTQHLLNDAWAFILYEGVTVDNVNNNVFTSFPSFWFKNFEGLVLRDVDVLGCGQSGDGIDAHGIVCKNGSALFLERVYADYCGGYGIVIDNVNQITAQNITGSLCKAGQIYINNCFAGLVNNVYIKGRNAIPGEQPPYAIGLFINFSHYLQFTNVLSAENTGDGVQIANSYDVQINNLSSLQNRGSGIKLTNCQKSHFTNIRTQGNSILGFNESDASCQYNVVSMLISVYNNSYSLKLSSSTSYCADWRANDGLFRAVTEGPIQI